MPMLLAPNQPAASNVPRQQRVDDRALERRAEVGDLRLGERPTLARAARSRSTAVFRPLKLKSARCSNAFSKPGGRTPAGPGLGLRSLWVILHARQIVGAIVAALRHAVDHRPAGIAEAEQLGHLVVGLARRVVAGAADQVVLAVGRHQVEAGVPAGDDEHDRRQRQRPVVQDQRLDVAGEMVHGDERHVERHRHRLGRLQPDQQRADQARPLRHRDGTEIAPADAGVAQRPLEHAADVAQVLPRRELGHDPAPLAVERHLRGDDVRADAPGLVGRAGLLDDRRGGLVARALDAEDQHDGATRTRRRARRRPALAEQARQASPRSRARDALLGDDRRDVAGRRDVEGRIADLGADRRHLRRPDVRDLARRPLLDRDAVAVRRREVDGRQRRRDVERDAVLLGQHGDAVGADLVGGVAVGGDAVGADDDQVDQALAHQRAGHVVGDHRRVDVSFTSSHAVRRAPCRNGRVSSASTLTRLPASTAPRITPSAVP